MTRKPKNIYEALVLEKVAENKRELRATISPLEREMEEILNSEEMKVADKRYTEKTTKMKRLGARKGYPIY